MKDERYEHIDKAFLAFSFSVIQDFFTILLLMERNSISHEELLKFKELKKLKLAGDWQDARICPECKELMTTENVNVSPRTMTGDDSTIVHTCRNPGCMHQIFE